MFVCVFMFVKKFRIPLTMFIYLKNNILLVRTYVCIYIITYFLPSVKTERFHFRKLTEHYRMKKEKKNLDVWNQMDLSLNFDFFNLLAL